MIGRFKPSHPNSVYEQPGGLYRDVFSDTDRDHLIQNLVGALTGVKKYIQIRQCKLFYKCDPDYGTRVAQGLGIDASEIKSA